MKNKIDIKKGKTPEGVYENIEKLIDRSKNPIYCSNSINDEDDMKVTISNEILNLLSKKDITIKQAYEVLLISMDCFSNISINQQFLPFV